MDKENKAVKKILERREIVKAPRDLSKNILTAWEKEIAPVHEARPLIPKWVWFSVFAGLALVSVIAYYSTNEVSSPRFEDLMSLFEFQVDLSVINPVAMTSILILGLMTIINVAIHEPDLKRFYSNPAS